MEATRKKITNVFRGFESKVGLGKAGAFLKSNSLVAKVAFLILVILAFILLLRLGTSVFTYLFTPPGSPKIISGMYANTKAAHQIPQKPGIGSKSKTILRSVNQRDGIEFTWSVWIWISGLEYKSGQKRHIFSKGNNTIGDNTQMMTPNNAPGLYIHPTKNALIVVMNTFDNMNEEVVVDDIPLNKWVNVMLRCEGKTLDVYINGTIAVRHILSGVPKQNYGDVWITANGGYDGMLSDLWYFDYALNTTEIMDIVLDGPDMTVTPAPSYPVPLYFSLRWFFNQAD